MNSTCNNRELMEFEGSSFNIDFGEDYFIF